MKKKQAQNSKNTWFRWSLLALIGITNIYIVTTPAVAFLVFLLPITFALLHSFLFFGKKNTLVIFGIIMLVSYFAEFIGVHTGHLFGSYYYNNDGTNGFLLWGVPPLITFSYASMGYICYILARIILGQYSKLKGWMLLGVPTLAATFMTIWDMSFDPVVSYIKHLYIWEDGGAYFGVPIENFTGWFITTFTFFIIISLYLNVFAKDSDFIKKPKKTFLAEVIVGMFVNALAIIVKGFTPGATDLHQAMGIIALFALGMPMLIATFRLIETKRL